MSGGLGKSSLIVCQEFEKSSRLALAEFVSSPKNEIVLERNITSEMQRSQGTYNFRCCKSFPSCQLVKRLSKIFWSREQKRILRDSMSLQILSVGCLATRRIIAS